MLPGRRDTIPLKQTLDEAMVGLSIPHVIVARRVNTGHPLKDGELDFADLLTKTTRKAEPVPLEANDPGFIIYTSGTTSKPKGLVHAGLGFLVGAYANVKWSLALDERDSYWCTADVGWLTFPIFALVGGLANGATLVVFEGSLDTPSASRPYELMAKYAVNVAEVLREDGSVAATGELGALTLAAPFPCLARTVWGDHDRYVKNYLTQFPGHYAASDGALFDADDQLWVIGRLDHASGPARSPRDRRGDRRPE